MRVATVKKLPPAAITTLSCNAVPCLHAREVAHRQCSIARDTAIAAAQQPLHGCLQDQDQDPHFKANVWVRHFYLTFIVPSGQ